MFGSEKYSEEDSSVGDTVITSGVNFGETRSRICRNSLLFLYLYKDLQWSKNKSYEYAKRIWEWWAGRKQGRGQWKLGQILGEDEVGVCRALHLEGNVEASPFSMLVLIESLCGQVPMCHTCGQRTTEGSQCSLYVHSGDQTQLIQPGGKCLYLLSHLTSQKSSFMKLELQGPFCHLPTVWGIVENLSFLPVNCQQYLCYSLLFGSICRKKLLHSLAYQQ